VYSVATSIYSDTPPNSTWDIETYNEQNGSVLEERSEAS